MSELTPMAEARLRICNGCAYNMGGDCAVCGCSIADKVSKIEEACPLTPPSWVSGTGFSVATQINERICVPCSKRRS